VRGVIVQPQCLSLQMSPSPCWPMSSSSWEETSLHSSSPPPTHLPFLPVYARAVGEGLSSQEPHTDAVRNIGFNELQNEAAAADMYGWCPYPFPLPAFAF
jgi:hypothetical protein